MAKQPTTENEGGSPSQAKDAPLLEGVGRDVQAHLGKELRSMYGKLVDEPVPEKFLKLINDLKKTVSGA